MMMKFSKVLLILGLVASLVACSSTTSTDNYPNKTIEVVAAGSPGGGLDTIARVVDEALKKADLQDQPFTIKNLGGGGGNEARAYIEKQDDNPYSLLTESNRVFVNEIVGTTDLGIEEVTPIARMMTEYLVWVVKEDSAYTDAKQILDDLKEDPSAVQFGVGTIPSNDQMNILRPAMEYGVDPTKIPVVAFKSGGDLMTQLLGGHIQVISTGLSEAIQHVEAGNARILAISSPEQLNGELADIPTWKSMGIDVSILHWRGIFGPPNMPEEAVKYWDEKLGELVKTDTWKELLEKHGWFDAYADSATFKEELEEEKEIMANLLESIGLAE
ncbi:Bug family tripartite tricarboxylate transporter substrate binding protein [Robertmurraya kyonggiensis]|uniref:Tripartite tricarboxylate transporter substrate binding protein n=1 Tax=Robertmurraya kyonggiensis TaxID=1037680 RepID=A0A4U1D9B5_9BACI|nr:tripartite tricarboxylate transporter substrate-binding protein [Robertmurraya kyonggiensis]TKC18016.1 tripartite tricarboxylate transporter substrate binding protein [Robertmurraya kyonggiensis]